MWGNPLIGRATSRTDCDLRRFRRELAEVFIENHRAGVYYRPPVHRPDLAEGISKIVGQKTVNQSRFSYGN
jgi:type IV secretory pathway TraG/TraD family ATPase VirD4